MFDAELFMADATRILLAFLAGMLTYPICYLLGARRQSRPPAGRGLWK